MEKDQWLDRSSPIRAGEELDLNQLDSYLRSHLDLPSDALTVTQFSKGFSNLTYLLRCGEQEYVLRRPPFGTLTKTGHNMEREYTILAALSPVYSKAPRPYLMCRDEAIIGAPFYLMERVKGTILRAHMPADMQPAPGQMRQIAGSLVDTFNELHQLDVQAIGLEELGRPEGYTERQVSGWTKRYRQARTDDAPDLDPVANWLANHIPVSTAASLIHNDYKYDNLVLDPADWTQVRAVLDWEMATLGDPLMDLGTTLGYWINPDDPDWMKALSLNPSSLPGNPSREELVELYAKASGRDVSNIPFYYVYGLFKIAGIVQQIYFRYRQGATSDARFASLGKVVQGLGAIAGRVMETGRLDRLF